MLRILFGAGALSLFASGAFACDGQTGTVIFEDKFTGDSGGWVFGADDGLVLKAPGATLTVGAGEEGRSENSSMRHSMPRKEISAWKCPSRRTHRNLTRISA